MSEVIEKVIKGVGTVLGVLTGNIFLALAGSVILSALGGLLARKSKPAFDLANKVTGRTEMITAPIAPRRTIYGTVMVSGPIAFAQTYGKEEGIPNAYLSLVIALAGHEVEAITQVWFGDQKIAFLQDGVTAGDPWSTRAKADPGNPDIVLDEGGIDFAHVWRHLGATDQIADSELVAKSNGKWTSAHRLRGIAYVHVQLRWDDRVFASGIPEVRCVVQGKKLTDTRTSTTAFSHNPALAVYDYLTNHLGIDPTDIDTASVNAAANVCEEQVALKAGGTEDRYRVNGTVEASERPIDVLAGLLGAMAGTLVITGGKFTVYAGAATPAVVALTEADIIGPVTVQPRLGRRAIFNAVKPVYVDPERSWQPVDAASLTNAAYEAADGGQRIAETIEFAFETSRARARRLGKIQLERTRQQITVEADVNLIGLRLAAWSTCTLTIARFGWSAKKFRAVGWQLNPDASVHLTLREEADAMWSWASSEEGDADPAPDTELPDPRAVPQPGAFAFAEELTTTRSGVPTTTLTVTIGAVTDGLFDRYEAQFRISPATAWRDLGSGAGTLYEINAAKDGAVYEFRARAINAIGAKSRWTTGSHAVTGQTAPPADVTNFRINIVGDQAELAWDPVGDVDLHHYRIRFSSATTGVGWTTAIDLRPAVSKAATGVTVPARVGTYLIKAVDYKGNASVNAATIVTTVPALGNLNVIQTITESTGFAGTHVGTAAPDGVLQLDTSSLFDGGAGNFDDANGLFDAGGGAGNIAAEGFYTFATTLDLGASYYPNRASTALQITTIDHASTFDDAPGDFDDRAGPFDGSVGGEVAVELQTRTTDDDPNAAPAWSAWRPFDVGDFKARAMQFRARLTSTNVQASPGVTALAVTIDMPDRVTEQHDLVIPAAGLGIAFPGGAFKAVPALGVSVQDGASGDRLAITAKTAAGFTLRVFDSGGSGVARTADYVARGYGVAA